MRTILKGLVYTAIAAGYVLACLFSPWFQMQVALNNLADDEE